MLGFWDQNNKFQYLPAGDLPDYGWSLYKRNKAYTGACIRIATSAAGNAETDIGFVNGKVDTAAILAHVGSNTAWVKTIYGQFGSVNLSMIYGLFTYAPRIATGGSIITFSNGEPAIEFGQGTSGNLASGLFVGSGDLFSTASSMFYSYESTYAGLQALGGSGSSVTPYHTATENGQTGFASSAFFDPDPTNLYVDETNPISVSGSSTPDAFHDVLIGSGVKIACETDMDLSLGNGYSWGMRWESTNLYFRGKSSEMLIYNDVRSSSQVYDIMKILNKSVKAY